MKRRDFMISASAAAAGMTLLPKMAFAEPNKLDIYFSSDQNVIDFWTNIIKPKFEAANPGVTINLVDASDSAGLQAIEARSLAALGTNSDPQADFFEGSEARLPAGALDKGLYVEASLYLRRCENSDEFGAKASEMLAQVQQKLDIAPVGAPVGAQAKG